MRYNLLSQAFQSRLQSLHALRRGECKDGAVVRSTVTQRELHTYYQHLRPARSEQQRRTSEMSGYETWANLNVLKYEPKKEPESREEYLRQERIAVGRICRCGACLCCKELNQSKKD